MNALCEGSKVVLDGGESNGSRPILDTGIASGDEGPRATEKRVLVDGLGKGGGGMVTAALTQAVSKIARRRIRDRREKKVFVLLFVFQFAIIYTTCSN